MSKSSYQLQKATRFLADEFEKVGADVVIVANYGDGNGGCIFNFKGDTKTMLPAILTEAARSSKDFSDAIKLASKSIKLIESGQITWPNSSYKEI